MINRNGFQTKIKKPKSWNTHHC